MDGSKLLVRKFPLWLKAQDKESLLKYFGATEVTVMADKGKLRNCAFAQFSNPQEAKTAMMKLHQLDVFGCKLVVVYATARNANEGSVVDNLGCDALKKEQESAHKPSATATVPAKAAARLLSTQSLLPAAPSGLSYLYPPPNQLIISNIANAIGCVPKLYVQVLHLMNKMNLPPPFGAPTPAAPNLPLGPSTVNVGALSSEESEMESDQESRSKNEVKPLSLRKKKINTRRKRRFIEPERFVPQPKACRVDEAFPDYTVQKRLELSIPEELNTVSYVTPDVEIYQIPETTQTKGVLQNDAGEDRPSPSMVVQEREEFIGLSEIESNRLTVADMQSTNVFKNYDPGEQSMRLYVKNLNKLVSEKDLRYIYGRYVDWDSDSHVNSFDVRVMQQGRMKGQAFVGMPSEELALRALQDTNGYVLQGKPMVVQFARSTKAKETDKILMDTLESVTKN